MKQFILTLLLSAAILAGYSQDNTKVRCTHSTTKGKQCKNPAITGKTYCTVHDPNIPRCGSTDTSTGDSCKTRVKAPGMRCWRHTSTN